MNQGFRQQPSSSQQSSLHQQHYLQSGSSSEIGEMMKLQKKMFSGRQDSMKVQLELFFKTMQQLTACISNLQVNPEENELPVQTFFSRKRKKHLCFISLKR
jgi:hypothetical protein